MSIRRSLAEGWLVGFATGMAAATADAAYARVASFGLTAASGFLAGKKSLLALMAGIFLCYLGLRTLFGRLADVASETRVDDLYSAYLSSPSLTLTNPMTIVFFVALFPSFGTGIRPDYWSASILVLSVFAGSALWWLILSNCVGLLRSRVNATWLQTVNL